MNKTFFLAGGAGFIGSHMAENRLNVGKRARIKIFDNFSSGKADFLCPFKKTSRLIITKGDLKNLQSVIKAMNKSDIVYHFAANPDIAKAVKQPDIDFWEGTYLTQNVLEAMRVNQVKKIFYTSGSGVYGENISVNFSEKYGPCMPISTYGASKLACEALIGSYVHMFGITARIFRFANVVGPKQTHGVAFDFINKLKQNPRQLTILGNGLQNKSYIHIDDVLSAIHLSDINNRNKIDIFNVASEDYINVRDIADIVCKEMSLKKVTYLFTGGDRGWKGDVPIVRFDCAKIRKTGWRPMRNSSEAVTAAVRSMLKARND
jgi:UDP-glucose 4-epimerase